MKKKMIILSSILAISLCTYGILTSINKKHSKISPAQKEEEKPISKSPVKEINKQTNQIKQTKPTYSIAEKETIKTIKNANLYNENNFIPLSAVADISTLSANIKDEVNSIIENSNLYYLKKHRNNIFIIAGNSNDEKLQRHDIQLIEINNNGEKKITELGNIKEHAGDNDEWEYDKISNLPIKHTKYNSKGEIEFVEIWNYSQNEPIKYELRDGNDKVLSIKKETYDNDSNMRVEHLIYDESGDTKINISANYEGPNITRFTYFNSEKPHDSVTLMSDFEDGTKTKETIYSSNYKVKNSFNAEYKDGERINIKKYDAENNLVEKIVPEY